LGFGSHCWGAIDRFLGVSALGMGDVGLGIRLLEQAVRANLAVGALPLAAHANHDLARALKTYGDGRWVEAHDRAISLARTCGMDRLVERIRSSKESQ